MKPLADSTQDSLAKAQRGIYAAEATWYPRPHLSTNCSAEVKCPVGNCVGAVPGSSTLNQQWHSLVQSSNSILAGLIEFDLCVSQMSVRQPDRHLFQTAKDCSEDVDLCEELVDQLPNIQKTLDMLRSIDLFLKTLSPF